MTAKLKALALDNRYVDAYMGLAGDYFEKGEFELEVVNYQKAALADPHSEQALCYLGTAYEDVGNYSAAVTAYKSALAIDPNYREAIHDLVIIDVVIGKCDDARELLPRLMKEDNGWGNEIELLLRRTKCK